MTRSLRYVHALTLAGVLVFGLSIISAASCAGHAPPNLTPQATTAWYGTRVIKTLDLLRDVATDANAQTPPLISRKLTRQIVEYHQAAITIVHSTPSGWKAAVQVSTGELLKALPANEKKIVGPYIQLVLTIIKEVTQ